MSLVFDLRRTALMATALVPVSFMSAAQAQERIAQDPHDSSRAANAAWISRIPESCVNDVMTQASDACPNNCMIRLPNSALPKNDACDKRTWICDWPTQPIGENPACPAGWVGSYSQDHFYQVENCGTQLTDTGKINVRSVNCKRDRPETRIEACPANGNWTGAGVTYGRVHHESLGLDLTTAKEDSVSEWSVNSVDCKRSSARTQYSFCAPVLGSSGCTVSTVNGTQMENTCPNPLPTNLSQSNSTAQEHLATDLVTVVTDGVTAPTTVRNDCAPVDVDLGPAPTAWGGEGFIAPGAGVGAGGDSGDCPVVIDLDNDGVTIIPLTESKATFNFNADVKTDSKRKHTAWYGPHEGILARDINGNGMIDDIREVFGGTNLDGFTKLASQEDTNHDGLIDAKDAHWKELVIWIDKYSDGVSEKGELHSLDEYGVVAINLKGAEASHVTYPDAYQAKQSYVITRNGKRLKTASVFFTNATGKAVK